MAQSAQGEYVHSRRKGSANLSILQLYIKFRHVQHALRVQKKVADIINLMSQLAITAVTTPSTQQPTAKEKSGPKTLKAATPTDARQPFRLLLRPEEMVLLLLLLLAVLSKSFRH
jgi:hypothetical protein